MTEPLRDKLIRCGWVTNFNADTLVQLIERHFAALAQPEPVGPTGLLHSDSKYGPWEPLGKGEKPKRYCRGLVQPEPVGPTLKEISDWIISEKKNSAKWAAVVDHHDALSIACAAIHDFARRGRTAALPVGPTDERITSIAKAVQECARAWAPNARLLGNVRADDIDDLCNAVIARWGHPAIEPIPVSQRLPGPKDCDAEGLCWWWDPLCEHTVGWTKGLPKYCNFRYSHWLPHWALPIPSTNPENQQ